MKVRMHRIVYTLVPRRVLLFLLVPPFVALPGLSFLCNLLSINFGNGVFGLTIVTCFGWILLNLNDRSGPRSTDAQSPLIGQSEYLTAVRSPSDAKVQSMANVLLALTGTVVLGWAFLIAS